MLSFPHSGEGQALTQFEVLRYNGELQEVQVVEVPVQVAQLVRPGQLAVAISKKQRKMIILRVRGGSPSIKLI